ncbi:MAG TPA: UdgX family uracil-DNA binding protein [Acidimicrobiales bacterium]
MPDRDGELAAVAVEAAACTRCELYRRATQTVFGEGPVPAPLLLVGEQPGDKEDTAGHPFVGPAGRVLDDGLEAAEIDREAVYVTKAVKHFKWEPRGKRRIHQRPDAREVAACRHWLDREVELVEPRVLVALGATALRPLFAGRQTVGGLRGAPHASRYGIPAVVTVHPSAIVRLREREERRAAFDAFVRDLRLAAAAADPDS